MRLEEFYSGLQDQFERMHAKWEIFAEEIKEDGVYKNYETDYNESKVIGKRLPLLTQHNQTHLVNQASR